MITDQFYQLTGIPLSLLESGKITYTSLKGSLSAQLMGLFSDSSAIEQTEISHTLAAALIHTGNPEVMIIAGPVLLTACNERELAELLHQSGLKADQKIIRELMMSKRCSPESFQNAVSFLYIAINHELPKESKKPEPDALSSKQLSEAYEAEWAEYNDEYTQNMCFLIEHGMTSELEDLMGHEKPAPYGSLSKDHLRHWKNSCFVLLYMVRKAAEKGGLDRVRGLRMAEEYSQKIDNAKNMSELNDTVRTMRMDYCREVCSMKAVQASSPFVRNAVRYIHEHQTNRLPLKEISDAAGVSLSYLCAKFKEETGMSVNAYIQKVKIQSAKQLLEMTDLSAAEIADRLSYSSQSHFQTAFRSLTGMTPKQYRRKKAEHE